MNTATLAIKTPAATAPVAPPTKSFWRRLYDAMVEARLRQAMREINQHRRLVPLDEVNKAGYRVTYSEDDKLPFVR
jgi:hypothetical protein